MKLEFCEQIFKKSSNMKFRKTCPVGVKLFHAGRRWTDMTKQIVAFREHAKKHLLIILKTKL
jgi:hypothetical protein